MLCYAMLCCAVLCYAILCCIILYYDVLFYTILYYITLHYIILYLQACFAESRRSSDSRTGFPLAVLAGSGIMWRFLQIGGVHFLRCPDHERPCYLGLY